MATATISSATPNSLIRGEIAAVETYTQAMAAFEDDFSTRATLQEIRTDHEATVNQLREHVREEHDQPADTSGVWGYWTSLYTGTAKLLGDQSTLSALRTGEEHGVSVYEKALDDETVDEEIKSAIRKTFLPRCQAHLSILDGLIQRAGKK